MEQSTALSKEEERTSRCTLSATQQVVREFSRRLGLSTPSTAANNTSHLTQTSERRRALSTTDAPALDESLAPTVLYLAYGSNLCDETFLGKRQIRPLSAVNVQVPELRLTFDLPGVPYMEPCFANTARRPVPGSSSNNALDEKSSESGSLFADDYHKDRWQKGLVGTVYEVTKEDYARIIATEGGGSSYQDVLVDCYNVDSDTTKPVPATPQGTPFKAHTLFAPVHENQQRSARPDPSYAQASARYMKLINDGAKERGLPLEYRSYLAGIRPYAPTTVRQRLGTMIFPAIWGPLVLAFFAMTNMFKDKKGRAPAWVARFANLLFGTMWASYDNAFKPIFGDGERGSALDDEDWEHLSLSTKSIQ